MTQPSFHSILEADDIDRIHDKIVSWRSSEIYVDSMYRIGVPVGGNSLLHAVLHGSYEPYQRQSICLDNFSKLIDRTELVLDVRRELSEKDGMDSLLATYQHIPMDLVPSIARQLKINIYLVGPDKVLLPAGYEMGDDHPNVYLLVYPTHYELLGQMKNGVLKTSFTRDELPIE